MAITVEIKRRGGATILGLPLECADIDGAVSRYSPLVGRYSRMREAAAVRGQDAVVTGVDGRTAQKQCVCHRRCTVILQMSKQRIRTDDIPVHAILYPARGSRVADKIVGWQFR